MNTLSDEIIQVLDDAEASTEGDDELLAERLVGPLLNVLDSELGPGVLRRLVQRELDVLDRLGTAVAAAERGEGAKA